MIDIDIIIDNFRNKGVIVEGDMVVFPLIINAEGSHIVTQVDKSNIDNFSKVYQVTDDNLREYYTLRKA